MGIHGGYRCKEFAGIRRCHCEVCLSVESSLDVAQFEPWFVSIALTKLRAFQQTEYDRVQLLDMDSFVWFGGSMDQIEMVKNGLRASACGS